MQILQGDITYTLQSEISNFTIPFVNDADIKGPQSQYQDRKEKYETISENPGI